MLNKKESKDFKNSKKFWRFYSNFVNIKSGRKVNTYPCRLSDGKSLATDPVSIANLFNTYFTNISSSSSVSLQDCIEFTDQRFEELFNTNFLVRPLENFKFEKINALELSAIIENMNAKCSPGFDGIPFKIFAESSRKILPFLEMLFNRILSENYIPSDFKCAVVTPLFKGKGSKHECTNYRGISILSPVTKLFETVLYKQLN